MVRRDAHALNWEQAKAVLEALASPARGMALSMILLSCNVAELLGLQWKRVNLSDEWTTVDGEALPRWSLAIRRQWYRGGYGSLKAKSRDRNLQIPAPLRAVLLAMRKRKDWTGPDDPVFASRKGTPLDEHNYATRHLKPAGRALKMPWLSWHVFRRTHATLTKILGLSDTDRMKLVGHGSISMTDRYTAGDLERQQEVLESMAAKLVERRTERVN
ncbi:MAG: tyrosine-type recombinase/integrase [Acidobacteriia bacterium]|nr:tyrosine-type recombinase/integrase [Terriglobia bacterium]